MKLVVAIIFLGLDNLYAQKLPITLFVEVYTHKVIPQEELDCQIATLLEYGDTMAANEVIKTGKSTIISRVDADSIGRSYYLKINGKKFTKIVDLAKVKKKGKANCSLYIQGVLKAKFLSFDITYFHKPNIDKVLIFYNGAGKKCSAVMYQFDDGNYPTFITSRRKMKCKERVNYLTQLILASPKTYRW